jgi:hypothetical protein
MTAPQIESMSPFFIVGNVDQIMAFYQEKLRFATSRVPLPLRWHHNRCTSDSCRRGPPKRSLSRGVRTSAPEWCRLSRNGRT